MDTLQEYLETIPNDDHRTKLEHVIQWGTETFPELKVEIKWNQPMMTHNGTFIISFSASSKHFSVAPERHILDEFRDKLTEAGYSHSKALFRILWTQDVNYALLAEIIERSIEFKKGSKTFWAK
ncbi:iron chaperone [Enteractinococcus coprophilus]|uniref:YdhG-like domain-containing protein n=1 Tax=Enteractinococcus coprophilus TaxID=1027633 RepID=A0A543AMK2_9MICC|nr:DUF1801 domain-containing protein [Enteractinococcus coprophilus]TQL73812.1 hypothetical protein FB556_0260 [Enteractinococcus coprophilus]